MLMLLCMLCIVLVVVLKAGQLSVKLFSSCILFSTTQLVPIANTIIALVLIAWFTISLLML